MDHSRIGWPQAFDPADRVTFAQWLTACYLLREHGLRGAGGTMHMRDGVLFVDSPTMRVFVLPSGSIYGN